MVGRYRSLGIALALAGRRLEACLSSHWIGGTLQGMDPSPPGKCHAERAKPACSQCRPASAKRTTATSHARSFLGRSTDLPLVPFSSAILSDAAVSSSPSLIGPQAIQRLTLAKPVAAKRDPTEPPSEPTDKKRIAKGKGATFCMCQERCPLIRPY